MGTALRKRWHAVRLLLASCLAGVAAMGVVQPGPAAGAPTPVCPGSTHVLVDGAWTLLERPPGLTAIRGAAVDTERPEIVYATDGRRVVRSTSGGCSWRIVLDLADRGAPEDGIAPPEITSVVVPAANRVYATVANAGPLSGTAIEPVFASFDGGRTWDPADGLPPGRPSRLRASLSNPDVMYLSMHTGQHPAATVRVNSIDVGDIWSFFGSTDGGRSWTRRSAGQYRARFVPDPIDSSVVWSLGSATSAFDGPYRSANGGVDWEPTVAQPANDLEQADLDVFHTPGRAAQLVVAQGDGTRAQEPAMSVYFSSDAGATFTELATKGLGGRVVSVAFGRSEREVVISSHAGVYRFVPAAGAWRDVDLSNLAPLMDATHIPRAEASWVFWRPELVVFYRETVPVKATPDRPVVPPPPLACSANGEFSPAELPRGPRAVLEAINGPVALDPLFPSRADFRLSLPAVPTQLDTYFLLDTSTSMGSAIDGVVCGLEQLVIDLSRAGVDGHFGLGEFQDSAELRYRRVDDIGPPDLALQSALRTRRLRGGEEPHRGALYQTATGAGLRGVAGDELIRPGQAATYRPNSLRVVLMVTDEPYEPSTTYEPAVPEVVAALRARNIHHIGIHVRSEEASGVTAVSNDALTRQQLEDFSRGTRTFAPAGGVDCDGDGAADVPPGAPLVCTVERNGIEANLAETLTAVLLAVREDGVAGLRPLRTAGMEIDVPQGRRINVRDDHTGPNALLFSANLRCSEAHAGTRHELLMGAEVSGREVARTPFDVACGAQPQTVPADRNPLGALAPPPALAPAPVTAAQPVLSGSVATSSAANPGSVPGLTVGQAPGVGVAIAPEERELGLEPISPNFSDATASLRLLGAGMLVASFAALEWRRRTARRGVSKAGARR